jgi:hypothetical protein
MLLSNDEPKRLVKIALAVKVYADGNIERSDFDNMLGKEALAKNGQTIVSLSVIKGLDLDFSYNEKNYKSAISDLYNQLQDLFEESEILDYCDEIDDRNSILVEVFVRDDNNTKVNVGQVRVILVSFAVDTYDPDAGDKVREVTDKIISTFDFHGIYVDYDEDFISIVTREI